MDSDKLIPTGLVFAGAGLHFCGDLTQQSRRATIPREEQPTPAAGDRLFHIWSEGFVATGERGTASKHGCEISSSLKGACEILAAKDPEFARYFDPERMTYWGCRIFDNLRDAAEAYG